MISRICVKFQIAINNRSGFSFNRTQDMLFVVKENIFFFFTLNKKGVKNGTCAINNL